MQGRDFMQGCSCALSGFPPLGAVRLAPRLAWSPRTHVYDTDVMDQLEQTVELVRDTLGPELVGTYLHGSAVRGGLAPASDLDVLTVTRRSLGDRQRRFLLGALLEISGLTSTVRPVELTVVVQSEVRPWRFPCGRGLPLWRVAARGIRSGRDSAARPDAGPGPGDHDGAGG